MSRGASKRRLRVRRKRRHEGFAGEVADEVATAAGPEVVGEFGCCVVEAVGGVTVILCLLLVPAWFVMS